MKIMIISILGFFALTSQAQENCSVSVSKDEKKVYWQSEDASGKYLFIKNLDTQLVYPQMILTQTKGSLSTKLLEPNVKGYQLILANISENTLILVNNHVAECSQKKDCSLKQSQVKLKNDKSCRLIKSAIIK